MNKQPSTSKEIINKSDTDKLPIIKNIFELQTEIIRFIISDMQPMTRIESYNFKRLVTSEWFIFIFD